MVLQAGRYGRSDVRQDPAAACLRCGERSHLIEDDGYDVCWVCVVAWGRYASLVAPAVSADEGDAPVPAPAEEPQTGRDPTVTALLHWSHRTPVSGCPLCLARR